MKRLMITVAAVAAMSAFGEVPAAKPNGGARRPAEPAEAGVRNPFWPIGYEGTRETISPEVRERPKPVVVDPAKLPPPVTAAERVARDAAKAAAIKHREEQLKELDPIQEILDTPKIDERRLREELRKITEEF